MKRITKNFLMSLSILILILTMTGCPEVSEEFKDGKITVRIINASPAEGLTTYIGIFAQGTDHTTDPPMELLYDEISGGVASVKSSKVYKEGKKYEIWFFIDVNSNADPNNPVPDGPDYSFPTPFNVKINGSKTVIIDLGTHISS